MKMTEWNYGWLGLNSWASEPIYVMIKTLRRLPLWVLENSFNGAETENIDAGIEYAAEQ